MADWSHGYDVSMGYGFGFGREMAPGWLDMCARTAGIAGPERNQDAPQRYLDLGSGQGMGLCLLAAANPQAEFLGVDFLPEHIEHSNKVAGAAGLTNVRFSGADFVDLAAAWPEDFGTFDYVVLHGIYSWVSPQLREAVVQCLEHAIRPGGLVYVAYNTQPGWLGSVPFQHVTHMLKGATGKTGRALFDESANLFGKLRSGNAVVFQILPSLGVQVEEARTRNTTYLVHEFLHDHWLPLWHSQVAGELGRAKLDYVGTATIAETLLPSVLPPPLRDTIIEQPTSELRQDLQDIVINQSFRRDVFCREPRREPGAADETLLRLIVVPAAGSTLKVETAFGEVVLDHPAFGAMVEALAAGPKSIGELAALPGMAVQGKEGALQILCLLLQGGWIGVESAGSADPESAHRLNAFIAKAVSEGASYEHIAAPVIGSAIGVSDIDLMLIDSWLDSAEKADDATLAKGVSERLATLGRKLYQSGKPREGAEAHERLMELANRFLEQNLPRWQKLGAL